MIHTEFKQGTDEWKKYKTGKISASSIWKILPGKTGRYLKERENYMAELAIERLTGVFTERFESEDMKRGSILEADARTEYELRTGKMIYEAGFIDSEKYSFFGISPDGIDSLKKITQGFEIKCRKASNHIAEIKDIISGKKIDENAYIQIQASIFCTGAESWDYILYNPDIKLEWLQFFKTPIYPDQEKIKIISIELIKFNLELNQYILDLEKLESKIKGE